MIGVRTCCFDDNSPNMHLKDEKKCQILPFQDDEFDKNSLFGPYFAHFPLFPADMVIFLLMTVNTPSFTPEKSGANLGRNPKSVIFHQYLVVTSDLPKYGVSGDQQ